MIYGRSIRTRLTGWYVALLAFVLLAYAVAASYLLQRDLRAQLVKFAIQDLETVEGLLYFDPSGTLQFRDDYHNHPESKLIQERLLEARSSTGAILYRNDRLGNRELDGPPEDSEGVNTYSAREVRIEDGTELQLVSRRHMMAGTPILLRLGYSLGPLRDQFRSELVALLVPLPVILGLAWALSFVVTRRALEPISDMSRRATQITSERLHDRLPVNEANGELADLARMFNEMLSRLESSFEQLRRFTSDASHELRTPLTLIRSVGEVGLQTDQTPEQLRDTIGSMLEEANRLTELVENLLTISRADAGQLALHRSVFTAMDLARDAAGLLDVLLEEKSQQLTISGDERALLNADWLLLRQALVNILHNAIKHSPEHGLIGLKVESGSPGWIDIRVEDSGPGIKFEDQTRIFDRFYRVDSGRSHSQGGVGLGLSIAQWTTRAHGGNISVHSAPPGAVFVMHLPEALSGTTF